MSDVNIPQQRLFFQHITRPAAKSPAEMVAWLGAVQAQDYANAKWGLGLRLQGVTDEDVERAFTQGAILRTHLLRPTWHFVTPDDIRWLLALTAPHVEALNAPMYRGLKLDSAVFQRTDAVLIEALAGGQQLTRHELAAALQQAGIPAPEGLRMAYIMMHAELQGVVCSGARRGKQFTYALLDERAPQARVLDRQEALAELSRRYFESRGPATVHDFARWAGLTVADARQGLEAVKEKLQPVALNGKEYWMPVDAAPVADSTSRAWLLSIYDEYISGYKERSEIIAPQHAARLRALGSALTAIIVLDGQVVGVWKRTLKKGAVEIATDVFIELKGGEQQAIAAAAQDYAKFLGLALRWV